MPYMYKDRPPTKLHRHTISLVIALWFALTIIHRGRRVVKTGSIHQASDVRWTQGGCRGSGTPQQILLVLNQFIVQSVMFEHLTASGDSRHCRDSIIVNTNRRAKMG